MMITASHNEPEWNGMKFVLNGRGVVQAEFDRIVRPRRDRSHRGRDRRPCSGTEALRTTGELVKMAGEGSCDGVKVAVDLNGGAAIAHAPAILRALGCDLAVIGGTPGALQQDDRPDQRRPGAPDQDGQREGLRCRVRLRLRWRQASPCRRRREEEDGGLHAHPRHEGDPPRASRDRSVVVSTDTTQAVDDVVSELGGKTYRSKVGEANVISRMMEERRGDWW